MTTRHKYIEYSVDSKIPISYSYFIISLLLWTSYYVKNELPLLATPPLHYSLNDTTTPSITLSSFP